MVFCLRRLIALSLWIWLFCGSIVVLVGTCPRNPTSCKVPLAWTMLHARNCVHCWTLPLGTAHVTLTAGSACLTAWSSCIILLIASGWSFFLFYWFYFAWLTGVDLLATTKFCTWFNVWLGHARSRFKLARDFYVAWSAMENEWNIYAPWVYMV